MILKDPGFWRKGGELVAFFLGSGFSGLSL